MPSLVKAAVTLIVILAVPFASYAGSLDSSGAPSAGSNMPTLTDIYNQLDTGSTSTPATSFLEPTSGPTAGTGKSISEIKAKLPAPDNANGATVNDVSSGKTFWGLRTDGTWGLNTGSLSGGYICATGDLSPLGRWCDNGDGTIRDMTTGLIWLKDAGWGGLYIYWPNSMSGIGAHDRVTQVKNGTPATLTDGSSEGDWRLPTKSELVGITTGTEYIRNSAMYKFTDVKSNSYWSSTTSTVDANYAWDVYMFNGNAMSVLKESYFYVWPVRSGQ